MAAEVYIDTIELTAPTFSAKPFSDSAPACYPYPELAFEGKSEVRPFQAIVLENDFLRASFLPELGGRLISLFDKRTDRECLLFSKELQAAPGGSRGFWTPDGIQWQIGEDIRAGSMAELSAQIVEGEGQVVMFELAAGTPLSWHLWIRMPEDRAELQFELRALNRSLGFLPFGSSISFPSKAFPVELGRRSLTAYSVDRQAGYAVHFMEGAVNGLSQDSGAAWLRRGLWNGVLAPRQSDHWEFSLTPISGLPSLGASTASAAVHAEEGGLSLQVHRQVEGKLYIHTSGGQTLEAPCSARPTQPERFDFPADAGLPSAILLRDKAGQELLRWPSESWAPPSESEESPCRRNAFDEDSRADIERARRDVRLRGAACVASAQVSIREENFGSADEALEQALLFNGDDPLAWWLKAAVGRHLGEPEDAPELPNAHYLAPMEPLLRAEAFFRQPHSNSSEPSALIKRVAEEPEHLVEVSCALLAAGLRQEAARWLDEALKHRDLTMLRLLSAWNLYRMPHLRSEAAIHVGAADAKGLGPPYPWRPIEARALEELRGAFPDSPSIKEMHRLMRLRLKDV